MSVNKYRLHLLLIPEDDANRQIANGFMLENRLDSRAIQILPPPGGWKKTIDFFIENHIEPIQKYAERRVMLLVDFDNDANRFHMISGHIPTAIRNRVFVLGCLSEPEQLRNNTRMSYEMIGKILAEDCVDGTDRLWSHPMLRSNRREIVRFKPTFRALLR
ncbi:MAG: hypothetical protein ACLFRG_06720 [Desulfococcaceae bacterium]